jgi:hypothetical protein
MHQFNIALGNMDVNIIMPVNSTCNYMLACKNTCTCMFNMYMCDNLFASKRLTVLN